MTTNTEIKPWRSTPEASQISASWDAVALADREIYQLRAALASQQGAGELPQDARAAFEKIATELGYAMPDEDEIFDGIYHCSDRTERAWKVWQAALSQRAASVPAEAVQPVASDRDA